MDTLPAGTLVFTSIDPKLTDWTEVALRSRKDGAYGKIVRPVRGHGLCYEVSHDDGSVSWYDPGELSPVRPVLRSEFRNLRLMSVGDTIQISGAIWSGEGKSYLCLFPGESLDDLHILQMSHEEWEAFVRQTDVMQTEVLSRASDGKLAKVIVRKGERQIDAHTSWRVYARDGFRCRYCGKGDGTPLTVDHLICWEEGGPSTEANLVASCKKCNRTRGNTRYQEWLDHPYYKQVSKSLTPDVLSANERLAETLDNIPLKVHARSR